MAKAFIILKATFCSFVISPEEGKSVHMMDSLKGLYELFLSNMVISFTGIMEQESNFFYILPVKYWSGISKKHIVRKAYNRILEIDIQSL